ncbi:MAG: LacI family DNA-binding transcriptional regulator [Bacteroidota bacterium]
MEKKVNNIKELADKLKLSPTTVSRVLNGKSKKFRISQNTSQKVLDAARKYHYSPNRIARSLKMEKTETIGLIIPDIANPYFSSIAKTIEVEAHNNGYSIILCDSLDDEVTEAELLQLLAGRKVDGIIIAPTGKSSSHVTEIQRLGIPVMVIDRYLPDTELPFVTTDNHMGALLATEHFIETGHRNIACIQGINGISANSERVAGYRDALRKHRIPVNESMILGTDFGEENGYIQTKKLLDLPKCPTAIFALSNLISLGTLRALKEEGLKVPEDVSIISFDEQPYSAFLACPMTTVEQPREEIGRLAFNFLLKTVDDGRTVDPVSFMLQPRLIYRESVKKILN